MSLLEDVFLENEAGEAQELERIIEGDEFDERPRSRSDSDENSAKEDEAEEDKRRVDPTNAKPKRVIKNPRFVLNPARLTGPRGIQVLPEHFKDFKFKGKGHEREDLDLVLKKLEHWAYRLYPKFAFQDCLRKIETLGKKRPVSVYLTKIRMDLITSDETVVQRDSSDDEVTPVQEPEDEFDKLLQQQIEIARATPASKNTPFGDRHSLMPKATSSPSINDEQRERMLRNRRMAEERRLARLQQITSQKNPIENSLVKSPTIDNVGKKHNQLVIDSSDDDVVMNKSVTSDIHDSNKHDIGNKSETAELVSAEDDGVMNNSVTVYDSNKDDIVKLDDDDKLVTKSPKRYVPAKKHNKSGTDSSDDSDALVINEPATINIEKHHNDKSTRLKNIPNKNIDSSADDDLDINEPITVDVENHHDNVTLWNKPNITDSSEDEEEAVVMNQSITVDIHDSNKCDTSSSNKPDINKNDCVFDSLKTANTVDENVTINEGSVVEIQDTEQNKFNYNVSNYKNLSDVIMQQDSEEPNNLAENTNKIVCETNSDEIRNQENDENVSGVENVDAMMDVDFSDEF